MENELKKTEILNDPVVVVEKIRHTILSKEQFFSLALPILNDLGRKNLDQAEAEYKFRMALGTLGSFAVICGASALFYFRSKWTYYIKIPIIAIGFQFYPITDYAFAFPITYYYRQTLLSIVDNPKFRISANESN